MAVGIDCWDLNGNHLPDPDEDRTGDGVFDVRDCQGSVGPPGPRGLDGADGAVTDSGAPGHAGMNGRDCWDTNANGFGEAAEDLNHDGRWDAWDCVGVAGGRGSAGANGPAGRDGAMLFHVAISDFFTADPESSGQIPIHPQTVDSPVLRYEGPGRELAPIAFRFAVPHVYTPGNDVVMRLHFQRTGPAPRGCFVFALDARRLRPDLGIRPFDHDPQDEVELCNLFPESNGCGRRWVRLDLPANGTGVSGNRPDDPGELGLTVDLPLNTPGGLDYPGDLTVSDFLAFELTTVLPDGGTYELLGVEFEELHPGEAVLLGATVFADVKEAKRPAGLCPVSADD